MSGRGASGAILTEWGKASNRPIHLFEFDFNPWIYLTDAAVDIQWNGNNYLASQVLGYSGITETSDLLVNSCTITLSGVDQAVIAILLQETYLNRKCKIRTAMLDAGLTVIADPVLIFDGRMDKPAIAVDPDSGTVTCGVEGVSHWTDFERRPGRHSNDTEQQTHFPGDKGFSGVASMTDEIFWGVNQKLGDILVPGVRRGVSRTYG